MRFYHLFALTLLSLLATACSLGLGTDADDSKADVTVVRFDRAVDEYLSSPNFSAWQSLITEYPRETRILVEDELHLGSIEDEHIGDSLKAFFQDSALTTLRADVSTAYPTATHIEKELSSAFQRLIDHCPGTTVPQVYTQVSALTQSIVVGDSIIGISLDKYLGSDYPLYRKYYSPAERRTMVPGRIVPDCLNFYLDALYSPSRGKPSLGYLMIHLGKFHWVTAQLLGRSLLDEATADKATQRALLTHEAQAWQEISRPGIAHSTDSAIVARYMGFRIDSLPKANMPPPGIGLWVGMRIVDSYMRRHKQATLLDLLQEDNYEKLVRESGYKPARPAAT